MRQFCRTEMMIGEDGQRALCQSHVAVFGLGGVGSYAAEALARAGVGKLTLVDFDTVDETNINRQLLALHSTVGLFKTDVAKARVADINPNATVEALRMRFDEFTAHEIEFPAFDYVIDAIDTVTSKLLLAKVCSLQNVPLISCMGTGNKLDPTAFRVADIFQTKTCPLAKVMRKELRAMGVEKLKVVYSEEQPMQPRVNAEEQHPRRKATPSSISFVPPVAGMILAGEAIKFLIETGK